MTSVQVFHLAFAEHQRLVTGGIEVESYHPGLAHRFPLRGDLLRLFMTLFPQMLEFTEFGAPMAPRLRLQDLDLFNAAYSGVAAQPFFQNVKRNTRLVFRSADDETGFHAGHVGGSGELLGEEGLERPQIGRDALEDEIHFAVEHVALAHQRPALALGLESREIDLGLTHQTDHGKDLNLETQFARIDLGVIAADIALLLERADPPQTGRRRNTDPLGEFDVGHAPIGLKLRKDHTVDFVEFAAGHGPSSGNFAKTTLLPQNTQ
jgi:hypothetical protein